LDEAAEGVEMRPLAFAVLAAFVGLAVAACAGGSTPATSVASTAPSVSAAASAGGGGVTTGNAVTIAGFAFGPATLDVTVGTTVTWTNKDSATHTVTANDGSFDGQVPSGQMFSETFSTPGTYSYHCKIHPSMTATITVH
jgi:plastocyanin